ncbi:DUF4124 domain-containing protein [Paracidovorax wautersii]|uniref:DUF4124 domain-containing protein n=1 Tax=Paracidovorax wautersii TaxID=1177982 RepID=UPI0031D5832D
MPSPHTLRSPSRPSRLLRALSCAAGAGLLAAGAGAQVLRCTDAATGKVTYTDGSCGRGTAVTEVEPRKTEAQIRQEREQAAQAMEQRQQRLRTEAEQERLDAARDARERRSQARSGNETRPDPSQTAACQRARRQLQEVTASLGQGMYDEGTRLDAAQRQADLACLTPAAYAEAERARANRPAYVAPPYASPYYAPPAVVVVPPRPAPQPRPEMTQCNVFRCYDRQGNVYPH